jgi:hypothetical protein
LADALGVALDSVLRLESHLDVADAEMDHGNLDPDVVVYTSGYMLNVTRRTALDRKTNADVHLSLRAWLVLRALAEADEPLTSAQLAVVAPRDRSSAAAVRSSIQELRERLSLAPDELVTSVAGPHGGYRLTPVAGHPTVGAVK